jgi:KTSC domain
VPSTSIKKYEYDPVTRTLSVWFVASGKRYDYADVDPDIHDGFRRAFAKGVYFNRFIRDRHVSVHVPETTKIT